jgi:aspartate/methionine/tyrosine aminotransferase
MNLVYDIGTCSIAKYYPEGVIRGSSLSKDIGCGGHRLGWLTFPKELKDLMFSCNSYISSLFSCTSTPFQYGILDFFNKYHINEFNKKCQNTKNIFGKIIKDVIELLDKTKIKYIKPGFAWYIFLDFENYRDILYKKGITNSVELADYFMNNGIISVNGESFGSDKLTIRLSLIDIKYINGNIDHSNINLGIIKLINLLI